jgi:hypothetical protein
VENEIGRTCSPHEEMKIEYKIFMGKTGIKRSLERTRCILKDIIRRDFREIVSD